MRSEARPHALSFDLASRERAALPDEQRRSLDLLCYECRPELLRVELVRYMRRTVSRLVRGPVTLFFWFLLSSKLTGFPSL